MKPKWTLILLLFLLLPQPALSGPKALAPKELARFHKACRRLIKRASLMSVMGREGWLLIDNELEHLTAGRFWGEDARRKGRASARSERDSLPVLLDTQRQMAELGIRLILVPIPAKAIIYPESVFANPPLDKKGLPIRLDPQHQKFYDILRKQGLEVWDPTSLLLAHRDDKRGPLYGKHDTHYAGRATEIIADALASKLVDLRPATPLKLETKIRPQQVRGDLWQTYRLQVSKAKRPEPETLSLRFTGQRGSKGALRPLPEDRKSPLLIFGDSHGLIFHAGGDMHATGAGLADQLALALGMPVDVACVCGENATKARLILRRRQKADPSYLKRKKVAIWIFSVRGFSEEDWVKVPLYKTITRPKASSKRNRSKSSSNSSSP